MKKINFVALCVLFPAFLLMTLDLDARGGMGGGGGGGRGGGGARSGGSSRSFNRSPSATRVTPSAGSTMNRSVAKSANVNRAAARPNTVQRQPAASQQRTLGQSSTRSQVQDYLNQNTGARDIRASGQQNRQQLPGRVGDSQGAQLTNANARQLASGRADSGNKIRDQIGQNVSNKGEWFNGNFWETHGIQPPYNNHGGNGYWWKLPTAAAVGDWLRWDDNYPVYYDYNSTGDYWGVSDTDQSPQQSSGAATDAYTGQNQQMGSTPAQGASEEWMPLGVFALAKEKGVQTTPNIYLQLAINKDGLISGTYYNTTLDAAYELEGVADKSTKIAAWKIVDNDNAPILETGIYNLTQEQLPVKVNFADGRSQEFMMVRINLQEGG